MIDSIQLAGVATYNLAPESLNNLSNFNFIFGSNGTGKTTISKVIADIASFPTCSIRWKAGTALQSLVYNRDFVSKNFSQQVGLKGIFTLGETSTTVLAEITESKTTLDITIKKIEILTVSLQEKTADLNMLESSFKETCWLQKQKYDSMFAIAFEGYRGSSEKFKEKVFKEHLANSELLVPLSEIEKKAESIFGTAPVAENPLPKFDVSKINGYETDPILNKCVIGKEDVDIAAMIKKLGNSDWVKAGRDFYKLNDKHCPFCQQTTSDQLEVSLEEYFDETFEADTNDIKNLETNYKSTTSNISLLIQSIVNASSKFIDLEKLKASKAVLEAKINLNLQKIETKKKEPSQVVALEQLGEILNKIEKLITDANAEITVHNNLVANISKEKKKLTNQVWRYILDSELKTDLTQYENKKNAISKAVDGLNSQLGIHKTAKLDLEKQIRELEKSATSIQPTIDGINALLSSFGFQGFSLAKSADGKYYKLVRVDGGDAQETLSEGEKTFVTFLYFYYLLQGSESETGITNDRIVVFDDPISSLDSDILFIVGSLIKELFDEVRSKTGNIKQIFVLTHNVYFHKEVTYNARRVNDAMAEETFWIVRKNGNKSRIESHKSNPIKTSYELLWSEVRNPNPSNLTIQNTLRRIIENYFRILGRVNPDDICAKFEGKEKIICKSLFSWVNDGSHYAHDDLYVTIGDVMMDNYLNVFKEIFIRSKHLAHYEMMMGEIAEP